jgi:hypothetical protein
MRTKIRNILNKYDNDELSFNQSIDEFMNICLNDKDKETLFYNPILDTRMDIFIKKFQDWLKIKYGIENIKFLNLRSVIKDKYSILFDFNRFHQKTETGWLELSVFNNQEFLKPAILQSGYYCPKCRKIIKGSWVDLKEIRCSECNSYLFDYKCDDFLILK